MDAAADLPKLSRQAELIREGVTMALYISLSLLTVLAVLPDTDESNLELWLTILGTTVGLLIAHLLAFQLSGRLIEGNVGESFDWPELGVQVAGGLAVTLIAGIPFLFAAARTAEDWSYGLLLLVIGTVGYLAARPRSRGRLRAIVYAAAVVGLALVVVVVKLALSH